ncbi:MAG: 30S ribosomal protein S17 [Candidatus Brocadiae bacterium]|nr:30S ribosomal protein S17 [Candidatus Brocadiia bacterium]
MTVTKAKPAAEPVASTRGRRNIEVGMVTSAKMQKTIVVLIQKRTRHEQFEKRLTQRTSLYVHDEKNEARQGDLVEVTETRPLSRLKRWRLVSIVRKSVLATVTGAQDTVDVAKEKGGSKGRKKDEPAGEPAKAEAPKGKEKTS